MGRAFALVLAWLGLIGCFSLPYRDYMAPETSEKADSAATGGIDAIIAAEVPHPAMDLHNGRANEARKLAAMRRDIETEPESYSDAMAAPAPPAPGMTKIVIVSAKSEPQASAMLGRDEKVVLPPTEAAFDTAKASHTHRAVPAKAVGRHAKSAPQQRKKTVAIELAEARPAARLEVSDSDAKPAKVVPPPPMRLSSVNDAARKVSTEAKVSADPKPSRAVSRTVQRVAPPVTAKPVIVVVEQAAADRLRRKIWNQEVRAREIALYKRDGI